MDRRKFVNTIAATSVCALANPIVTNGRNHEQNIHVICKITVLKRSIETEFIEKYKDREIDPCSVFKVGQEFVVKSPWRKPEGFCDWAWADIRSFIQLVYVGHFNTFVSCCTDGFRPVFFKIEKIIE